MKTADYTRAVNLSTENRFISDAHWFSPALCYADREQSSHAQTLRTNPLAAHFCRCSSERIIASHTHEIYIRLQSHHQESSNISLGQCCLKNWLKTSQARKASSLYSTKQTWATACISKPLLLHPVPASSLSNLEEQTNPHLIRGIRFHQQETLVWLQPLCCKARDYNASLCALPHTGSIVQDPKRSLCTSKQTKRTGENFLSRSKDKRPTRLHPKRMQKMGNKYQHFQLPL